MFGKLFGKGSKEEALTTGDAIQKLRENEEMLEKKQQFLEKNCGLLQKVFHDYLANAALVRNYNLVRNCILASACSLKAISYLLMKTLPCNLC